MTAAALSLVKVVKRYGARAALNGVSLELPAGGRHGLIGPNGAGKTTLISLCCGFIRPTSGEVRVFGANPFSGRSILGRVGVLPQDAELPSNWTVGALLTHWATLSTASGAEQAARACLDRVGLASAWRLPSRGLSHGMHKRVALAQALLGDPPLLLLDEPTAGLDPQAAADIRALIRDLEPSRTVVISSHNLTELETLCDAAVILEGGRVKDQGKMEDLTQSSGLFKVQIARGPVPLIALRAPLWARSVELSPEGELTIRFDPKMITPEEAISQTLAVLLKENVAVGSVTRGTGLEARVVTPRS